MADFKTHIKFSTLTGILYGSGLYLVGVPTPTSAIAGGICATAGMIPDIDSKSSRALQECLYIMAGLVCVHVLTRLSEFAINKDLVLLVGIVSFILTKAGLGEIVTKHTKHRGLMHSIPMAVLAGEITFLFSSGDVGPRVLKAVALFLGFMSHLLLDEIYSVDVRGVRLKKSFGTALKFYNSATPYRSVFVYCLIFLCGYLLTHEPQWSENLKTEVSRLTTIGIDKLQEYSGNAYTNTIVEEWSHMYMWYMAYADPDYYNDIEGDTDKEYDDDWEEDYRTKIAENNNEYGSKYSGEQGNYRTTRYDAQHGRGDGNRQGSRLASYFQDKQRESATSRFSSDNSRNAYSPQYEAPLPSQKTNDNYSKRPFSREAAPRYSQNIPPFPSPISQQQAPLPSPVASGNSTYSSFSGTSVVPPPRDNAPLDNTEKSNGNKLIRPFSPLAPQ